MYKNKYIIRCLKTLYPPDLGDELAEELFRKASVNPHKTSYDVGMEELADLCYVYEEQCRRFVFGK